MCTQQLQREREYFQFLLKQKDKKVINFSSAHLMKVIVKTFTQLITGADHAEGCGLPTFWDFQSEVSESALIRWCCATNVATAGQVYTWRFKIFHKTFFQLDTWGTVSLQACSAYTDEGFLSLHSVSVELVKCLFTSAGTCQGPNSEYWPLKCSFVGICRCLGKVERHTFSPFLCINRQRILFV